MCTGATVGMSDRRSLNWRETSLSWFVMLCCRRISRCVCRSIFSVNSVSLPQYLDEYIQSMAVQVAVFGGQNAKRWHFRDMEAPQYCSSQDKEGQKPS